MLQLALSDCDSERKNNTGSGSVEGLVVCMSGLRVDFSDSKGKTSVNEGNYRVCASNI